MVVVTCTQHDLMLSKYNVHKIQDVEINLYKITENNFAAGTTQSYHNKCHVLIYLPHPDAPHVHTDKFPGCILQNILSNSTPNISIEEARICETKIFHSTKQTKNVTLHVQTQTWQNVPKLLTRNLS